MVNINKHAKGLKVTKQSTADVYAHVEMEVQWQQIEFPLITSTGFYLTKDKVATGEGEN